METKDIAQKLVDYCKKGENLKAVNELYAPNIVSVEATSFESNPPIQEGLEAVQNKNKWWLENFEVHSHETKGPFFSHDANQFSVFFKMDTTNKQNGQRTQMEEVGVYTVAEGKIVREQFMYSDS